MPASIALVTCAAGRDVDDDLAPLLAAVAALDAHVESPDWDDPTVDWARFDLAVVRSTWDYTDRLDEFLAWTRRAGTATRLVNDPAVLAWSSDKRYLRDLAVAGVRVVPTTFVESPDAVAAALPVGTEFVVKPTVSAGSRDTVRHHADDHDAATRQATDLLARGKVPMVQPYQRAVDAEGETALFYLAGAFSHAIGKGPLLEPGRPAHRALFAPERITAASPTAAQRALGDAVMAALPGIGALAGVAHPLPYARVDVLTADDGEPAVLEVELCEPSLFLAFAEGAAERFAGVLVELADAASASP